MGLSRNVLPFSIAALVTAWLLLSPSGSVSATPLSAVASVAVGAEHSCALSEHGEVLCWGWNAYGQLGDGTLITRVTPVRVQGLGEEVAAISLADSIVGNYSCALTLGGAVKCWGSNVYGALGIDQSHTCTRTPIFTTEPLGSAGEQQFVNVPCSATPVNVPGLASGVISISAGPSHACAVLGDGGVKCWGDNTEAQLGTGTTSWLTPPTDVCATYDAAKDRCAERLLGITSVAAAHDHTCGVTTGGHVKCWGSNVFGQLGARSSDICTGADHMCSLLPVEVCEQYAADGSCLTLPLGVVSVSAESLLTCSVTSETGLKCWGGGVPGGGRDTCYAPQTKTPRTCDRTPVTVVGYESGVSSVDPGSYHRACIVLTSGGVRCWGANVFGEVGDGTHEHRPTPVDACETYDDVANGCASLLGNVAQIAAGAFHTCAVTRSGGAKCWGSNSGGKLGIGASDVHDYTLPRDVVVSQGKGTGDADCDGEVSSLDALVVLRYEAYLDRTIDCPLAADANEDGSLDAIDAVIILQITARLWR